MEQGHYELWSCRNEGQDMMPDPKDAGWHRVMVTSDFDRVCQEADQIANGVEDDWVARVDWIDAVYDFQSEEAVYYAT